MICPRCINVRSALSRRQLRQCDQILRGEERPISFGKAPVLPFSVQCDQAARSGKRPVFVMKVSWDRPLSFSFSARVTRGFLSAAEHFRSEGYLVRVR